MRDIVRLWTVLVVFEPGAELLLTIKLVINSVSREAPSAVKQICFLVRCDFKIIRKQPEVRRTIIEDNQ